MTTLEIIVIFGTLFAIGLLVALFKINASIKKVKKFDELLKQHDRKCKN